MTSTAIATCRASIATHSKSFALASKLLPASTSDEAAIIYAYCRRADDAVDLPGARSPSEAVAALRAELESIYGGELQLDPTLAAFQEVVRRHAIPRKYPDELLTGMAMDAAETFYEDLPALLVYCYRVAGTVGLMMSHVFGVRDAQALLHAAHLGMGMQLTNICRDVGEDWERGRLYLPASALARHGAPRLREKLGGPLPEDARAPMAEVAKDLLSHADSLYASGEAGIRYLPFRAAVAVRTAGLVYSDIGRVVLSRDADPLAPRAVVSKGRKLQLALFALLRTACSAPLGFERAELSTVLGPSDVVSS